MKTIFNWLFVFVVSVASGFAQAEKPSAGFLRVVHLVAPGEGTLRVKLDGAELFPRGYELGQRTGGIGLPPGGHVVELSKHGVESVKEKLDLRPGETITVLAYAEKLPLKRENEPPRWAIKLRKLPVAVPGEGYRLSLISFCDREELVVRTFVETKRKTETTPLKRFQTSEVDLGRGRGGVEIRLENEALVAVSLDEPGNYVVLLYEDASGRVRALAFYNPKLEVAG
jgi:hypothetical protein